VERLLDVQDRPAQPRVGGHDQVPQRLRERPLAAYRNIDHASRHRRDPLEGGCPRALERGSGRAQAIRICGAPVGAAGKASVELRLDQWDHVHAVDAQEAIAFEQERCVDVCPGTSTARITTPERSALRNRPPRKFASTNSVPCRSSERVKVAMTSPSRAPRYRWRT
jgi:hypothetical protein